MRRSDTRHALRFAAVVAVLLSAFGAIAFAADPPTAAIAVTGTPTPGSAITAKATITIKDGSTLQSVAWKQVGGAPVVFTGGSSVGSPGTELEFAL